MRVRGQVEKGALLFMYCRVKRSHFTLAITVGFSQVQYCLGEGMEDEGSGNAQVELTFSNHIY